MFLLASIWESITRIDQTVLFYINRVLCNHFLDTVMPWLREAVFWLPLYIFLFSFAIVNFGKNGMMWIVFFILTVAACDQASDLIKNLFQRSRPCNDPFMMQYIKLRLSNCSSSFSFTSNHAANHFGIAIFIRHTFRQVKSFKASWFFVWAAIISYAQMYVGIHYPTDIIGGMLIGLFFGRVIAFFFNHKFMLQYPTTHTNE